MDEAGRMLDETIADRLPARSAAEARAATLFRDSRGEVPVSSAAVLAARVGTGDATVTRAARALGFSSLDDLRRLIAEQTGRRLTQAGRPIATLAEAGGDLGQGPDAGLDVARGGVGGVVGFDVPDEVHRLGPRTPAATLRP